MHEAAKFVLVGTAAAGDSYSRETGPGMMVHGVIGQDEGFRCHVADDQGPARSPVPAVVSAVRNAAPRGAGSCPLFAVGPILPL